MNFGGLGFAWIVVAGLVIALILIAIGAFRCIRAYFAFKNQLTNLSELPILAALDRTQLRIVATSAKFEQLDSLMARARAALEQIRTQIATLRTAFTPRLSKP